MCPPGRPADHRRVAHVNVFALRDLKGQGRPCQHEFRVGVQGFAQRRRLPVGAGVFSNVRMLPTLPHRGANKSEHGAERHPR